ncbi:hypothetical protein [Geomonas ferrireducens]|uniref:hypothetical protein n=1 Tax=Geomonas ferrireducens TaxID=2570227 RepID=UPI0010A8A4BA|nr:hypothetical protein [Geomonas ferrireducens]
MKDEYSEFDNYRWINCNRWSGANEVDALVKELTEGIASRKVDGYRINMKALVLDLYQSFLCDPEQYLAYSRDKADYTGTGIGHIYIKNHNISFDYLIGCIGHLYANGYIDNRPGGQFYDEESNTFHSYVSRMRPTQSLAMLFAKHNLTPVMISTFVEDDVLVLRGKPKEVEYEYKGKMKKREVKPPLKVPINTTTKRMAKKVRQYNGLLERSQIDVDIECLTEEDRDALVEQLTGMDLPGVKRIVLRLSNKSVYRVFNNGSMAQGGRYYGAWWISAPSIVRKYITIQGEPTVELDFSAMHIHLLYAKVGLNYANKEEDAYTLEPGQYALENANDDRDLNKLILLTAFNAVTPELAASGVFDQLRRERKLSKYEITNYEPIWAKLDLLKAKHPAISHLVANNFGSELQYYDSCVMEKVIEHFTCKGVPVLTVHDSVICQTSHVDDVTNMMLKFFYETVNELLALRVDPVLKYPHARRMLSSLDKGFNYIVPEGWLESRRAYMPRILPKHKLTIKDVVPRTLNIKRTLRCNTCSGKCRHNVRIINRCKFLPNIKLELVRMEESCISTLIIKVKKENIRLTSIEDRGSNML